MKSIVTMLFAFALFIGGAQSQELSLDGFPGCNVAQPKNKCTARIICRGVGSIYGNSGRSIQSATKEAWMNAKNELARFYSQKQKAKEALTNVNKTEAASNSQGGEKVKEYTSRLIAEVSTSNAAAILSGVVVLGRQINKVERTVTIKAGVSCKSQAAARKSQLKSAGSKNVPGDVPNSVGQGQPQKPMKPKPFKAESFDQKSVPLGNRNQTVPNADNF
jgi:hypothetical protein